jgi:hypothetical protein
MPETVSAKILLGWMDETEAMNSLIREARPQFSETAAREIWNKYREKVAAVPVRDCLAPAYQELTAKERYEADYLMSKSRNKPYISKVVKLDPSRLVVHQLIVTVDHADGYVQEMQDLPRRIRICLGRNMEYDGTLPKAENRGRVLAKKIPHAEFLVRGGSLANEDFQVVEMNRHVAVKEFDGRILLSAGYHRTHSSMYRKNPEDTVLPLFAVLESDADGFFSPLSTAPVKRDMVRGATPPLFSDFFNDDLCITLPIRKCRVELHVNLDTLVATREWLDVD